MLLGAHAFGNVVNPEDMEPRVAGGIFGQNLRGVVGAAVVGDPDVPLAIVVLCQDGIQRVADAGRLVACGNQDAHARFGLYVGGPCTHGAEGAVEPHQEDYVE